MAMDFRNTAPGTLVKRPTEWVKSHPADKLQVGILTGHKFVPVTPTRPTWDTDGVLDGVVCYPIIHWEGYRTPEVTHPSQARLARKAG